MDQLQHFTHIGNLIIEALEPLILHPGIDLFSIVGSSAETDILLLHTLVQILLCGLYILGGNVDGGNNILDIQYLRQPVVINILGVLPDMQTGFIPIPRSHYGWIRAEVQSSLRLDLIEKIWVISLLADNLLQLFLTSWRSVGQGIKSSAFVIDLGQQPDLLLL